MSLCFLLGAFVMLAAAVDPADGQEKKDPALKAPFDQFVKVEGIIIKKEGDTTGDPFVAERVPAYKTVSVVKTPLWRVQARAIGSPSVWNSLRFVTITEKDGTKHKIVRINGTASELTLVPEPTPKP